ncbi:2,3-bisphosphoglycerate-independent phosphoglycerate mutase [Geobacter pelophilus]|uniref:2,3-bisphosphoglycerate-independent phosphoglycerate mutase n=1 Tax=Geoanaerobacter pelophilus TaxID=60036 RepID=A0AAW4KYF0_9BACT|nr:2,3-bisphosphoglycerate-independent phosphoglycerate mutase [Geoanaerobacter pelophilus]MBT0663769.1 2,3-bisphosphoglycerate-independent phosphoglycerate mutase [Geoanaerobacter pelophilus]
MPKKPLLLMILDGWGINPQTENNAVALANTPNLNSLLKEYPHTQIQTSGMAVGLPDGQMGNSEVGHLNIGAGRVVYQDLTRISKSIADGDFFTNPVLLDCIARTKAAGGRLHLAGLLSDGGVHSHNTHLYGLLELAKREGLNDVFIHCLLDGRDTPPKSGIDYLEQLEAEIKRIGIGTIATVIGRYYAMDRDNRWDRVEMAYNAIVCGEGETAVSAAAAISASYAAEKNDEFVLPTVITPGGTAVGRLQDNDGLIYFNFRSDRAREITRALALDDCPGFARKQRAQLASYVCMTEYDATFGLPIAFGPEELKNIFGDVISRAGLSQLRIAETEKYAHVTFFFNGGVEEPFPNEERCLIPSPKEVATYDQKPEMSAYLVTDELEKRIESGRYDVIVLNFANCDMVGHTGIIPAAVKAVEAVDSCVGKLAAKVREKGGALLITADHGNADQMWDPESNGPHTAHTCNPVWLVMVDDSRKGSTLKEGGRLADIAPTMLAMLGLAQPQEMTGHSLLAG